MNCDSKVLDGTCPAPGGLNKKLHAKAAEKQQSITLVSQSFDERKIVVLRSDASDKTAKQNESDDRFRLADYPGVDTIFVNTGAFLGTYLVRLPTTGLLARNDSAAPYSLLSCVSR